MRQVLIGGIPHYGMDAVLPFFIELLKHIGTV